MQMHVCVCVCERACDCVSVHFTEREGEEGGLHMEGNLLLVVEVCAQQYSEVFVYSLPECKDYFKHVY